MEQTQDYIAFEVRIEGYQKSAWQGELIADEQVVTFESEIELIQAIHTLLRTDHEISNQSCCDNHQKKREETKWR